MNILITGSSGMLGLALTSVLSKAGHRITGLDINERADANTKPDSFIYCDITDYKNLLKGIKDARPDIIIHAAAFTEVDECESDVDKAETVNTLGSRNAAEAAAEDGIPLIYISTDFVFNGQKRVPYTEDDTPDPINAYGKSKLGGEKFVADIVKDFFIIRSSWMFGRGGKNFVDTILQKARQERPIKVVSDQFGSPTYTVDLAGAIAEIIKLYQTRKNICGVYHITNSDNCSWYRLAQKTLQLANIYEIDLVPITSLELDRAAERPVMSILDNARYTGLTGKSLRSWEKALEEYIMLR
jgi:dTDP-4-dehydrorhamnose reductase